MVVEAADCVWKVHFNPILEPFALAFVGMEGPITASILPIKISKRFFPVHAHYTACNAVLSVGCFKKVPCTAEAPRNSTLRPSSLRP